jgi:hypothetical protein
MSVRSNTQIDFVTGRPYFFDANSKRNSWISWDLSTTKTSQNTSLNGQLYVTISGVTEPDVHLNQIIDGPDLLDFTVIGRDLPCSLPVHRATLLILSSEQMRQHHLVGVQEQVLVVGSPDHVSRGHATVRAGQLRVAPFVPALHHFRGFAQVAIACSQETHTVPIAHLSTGRFANGPTQCTDLLRSNLQSRFVVVLFHF